MRQPLLTFRRAACLLFVCSIACAGQAFADPDALWKIVHDNCVPSDTAGTGPGKCALVDRAQHVALLKDLHGATQYLLIPTDRITGIEDPALLAPNEPNFWAAAWRGRSFVESRAGKSIPRDMLGLAVNSARGRSQNQLHIHIDCVRADVRTKLMQHAADMTHDWAKLQGGLDGDPYLVRRVDSVDLADIDPFRLLADGVPGARDQMGEYTVAAVAVGAPGGIGAAAPGFILLADKADPPHGDFGSSANLLDHDCMVLRDDGKP